MVVFLLVLGVMALAEKNKGSDVLSQKNERSKVTKVEDNEGSNLDEESSRKNNRKAKDSLVQKFEEAKTKYKEAKDQYENDKEKFRDLKEKGKCREDTIDCKSKKSELKRGVVNHLSKTIAVIDKSLQKMLSLIDKSTLSDEEKVQAKADIEALELRVTAEKDKIAAMQNATNEKVKTATKDLKKVWQDVQKEQHKVISLLISSRISKEADKFAQFGTAMQKEIDEISAKGGEVTELNALLSKYNEEVTSMNTAAGRDVVEVLKQIKDTLREFKNKVKEINQQLSIPESEEETSTPSTENTNTETTTDNTPPTETTTESTESSTETTETTTDDIPATEGTTDNTGTTTQG